MQGISASGVSIDIVGQPLDLFVSSTYSADGCSKPFEPAECVGSAAEVYVVSVQILRCIQPIAFNQWLSLNRSNLTLWIGRKRSQYAGTLLEASSKNTGAIGRVSSGVAGQIPCL